MVWTHAAESPMRRRGRKAESCRALAIVAVLTLCGGAAAESAAPDSVKASEYKTDVAQGAGSAEEMLKFKWGGRKRYPEFSDTQPCWHVQSVDRLPDRNVGTAQRPDWRAYFVWMSSNKNGGLIHVGETDAGIVDSTGRSRGVDGTDGKIIWHWSMQSDDAGGKLPGTNTNVGRWNHPAKADTLGDLLVIAMQEWNSGWCKPECQVVKCSSKDAVVWLNFANRHEPRFKATWRGSDFGHPRGHQMEITRVAVLAVPHREDSSKTVVLVVAGGKHGDVLGVAVDPQDPTDAGSYHWSLIGKKVSEWFYGKIVAGKADRVREIHDPTDQSLKITPLLFLDAPGDKGHRLPTEATINIVRDPDGNTHTVETFSSKKNSCNRASGDFVDGGGRGYWLCGQANNNNKARMWIRQSVN